ncbi:MAG: metallophosphoesterase family protein [Luteolibacter sp.]
MPKFAVISDLHCHPSSQEIWGSYYHCDGLRSPIKNHPVAALNLLIKEAKLQADLLLLPGDFTDQINQQGFVTAWQDCREIAENMGAIGILATIGNHDVDSRKNKSSDPFEIPKGLHENFPIKDPTARNEFWSNGFYIQDHGNVRTLVVNSVHSHHDVEKARLGEVTDTQLERIKEVLDGLEPIDHKIALCHHHPVQHEALGLGSGDLMAGGDVFSEFLNDQGFSIIVHGHKHYPRLRYWSGGDSLSVFSSGSLAATNSRGVSTNTRNLFHIIDLADHPVHGCSRHGTIKSWEFHIGRGWLEPNHTSASFPATAGFGSRGTPIQIAEEIAEWMLQSGGHFYDWADVIAAIPKVSYLIPSDLFSVAEILKKNHKIEIMPPPPDSPNRIGKLYSGNES